jgi:hypothetical protein
LFQLAVVLDQAQIVRDVGVEISEVSVMRSVLGERLSLGLRGLDSRGDSIDGVAVLLLCFCSRPD